MYSDIFKRIHLYDAEVVNTVTAEDIKHLSISLTDTQAKNNVLVDYISYYLDNTTHFLAHNDLQETFDSIYNILHRTDGPASESNIDSSGHMRDYCFKGHCLTHLEDNDVEKEQNALNLLDYLEKQSLDLDNLSNTNAVLLKLKFNYQVD